jgi:hypothetical protein
MVFFILYLRPRAGGLGRRRRRRSGERNGNDGDDDLLP